MREYASYSHLSERDLKGQLSFNYALSAEEMNALLESAASREYIPVSISSNAPIISKADVMIHAVHFLDKARENGYNAPVLYTSYAMAYHSLKDYDNEIVVLDEAILRMPEHKGMWEARQNKALKSLYDRQTAVKKAEEKAIKNSEKVEKKKQAASAPKLPRGRSIIQMDEDGNVIKVFETVTSASQEIGVSTKSIRDAANGVQKHAGGYRWAYKE